MYFAVKGSFDFFSLVLQFKPLEKRLKISLIALKSLCIVNKKYIAFKRTTSLVSPLKLQETSCPQVYENRPLDRKLKNGYFIFL